MDAWPTLTDHERAVYEWQMWTRDFGEAGQRRLKGATVMISRCGGLGSVVAYELAAAGVGRLVLAHGGAIKPSDLNRQLLMTHDGLGQSRVASAERRLKELNPRLHIESIAENVDPDNADRLVGMADVVVDAAPLFEERYAMNAAAVKQGKPMIEAAMYDTEAQLTTFVPGKTGCLRCLYPETSTTWTRAFPVFGAVSGSVACMAAFEVIKLIGDFGRPLLDELLTMDLRTMTFRKRRIGRDPACDVCGSTGG